MGGRAIARVRGSDVEWTYADHLGSPAAAANQTGAVLWREDHTPFGEARQGPAGNADHEGFTGHIADAASGLVYMQARYYDPVIGRFLSNDPVGFVTGGPAYFNRYAYTANDPVNYWDPDGEQAQAPAAAAGCAMTGPACPVGAAVGFTIATGATLCAANEGCRDAVAGGIQAGVEGARDLWDSIFSNSNSNEPVTTPDGREIAHGQNSADYPGQKGWTLGQIDDVLDDPAESYENENPNHRTGERQRTYTDGDGNWVVVDESGRVTQLNERGNDRQPPPEPKRPEG